MSPAGQSDSFLLASFGLLFGGLSETLLLDPTRFVYFLNSEGEERRGEKGKQIEFGEVAVRALERRRSLFLRVGVGVGERGKERERGKRREGKEGEESLGL